MRRSDIEVPNLPVDVALSSQLTFIFLSIAIMNAIDLHRVL